ncbi:hypothetical protein CROQUDRAFT_491546 [Cronartium quercuum f. sp. fusiforme G11]|uniref:Secreted protein n=1 Tax=Cronartium quercuum f. sp. fusiforme G11 TaxID=708437 RepID=A0A9P6NHC8_9BASI|nr:hypothetical protein CROQUDRAFT_491546 [Cronartium quercuum f. sp. fusiforme G11]
MLIFVSLTLSIALSMTSQHLYRQLVFPPECGKFAMCTPKVTCKIGPKLVQRLQMLLLMTLRANECNVNKSLHKRYTTVIATSRVMSHGSSEDTLPAETTRIWLF